MAILGLDLGTSAVKALLLSDGGRVLAVASSPCRVDTPRAGWAEADPDGWLRAAGAAVREARTRAGDEPVRAIGLAGQMHGVVVCDAEGRATRPALLWPDRRATRELERWRALPHERRSAIGNPLVPGMAGPMLAWLVREEPAALAGAAWALQPKDWLRLVLTGEAATDPSDASATLLWDLETDDWAADLVELAGIPAGLMPPVRESNGPGGSLQPSAAERLGLSPGVPVCVGAADTAAALLGAGISRAGQRLLNVGTGAQLVTVVDRLDTGDSPTTHRYRAARDGWYAMAAVQNAGLALGWVRDLLGATWEDAERDAFHERPRDGDPFFVPHLTGERTPLLDPTARGAWSGLALDHGRADILRAAYEGVAHAIRHAREALDAETGGRTGPLHLLGGGSLRPGYRQLLADTLGEPLQLLDVADATALGAAALAAGASPAPEPVATVVPDAAAADLAHARHERWRAVVAALAAARRGS